MPDWAALLDSWDRQQAGYVRDREQLIATMLDAIEGVAGRAPRVLDLACGPGAVSARVLARLPDARCVAVDLDPVLLAIGQGVLGDMDGRLRWHEADLAAAGWERAIGGGPFDAVVSTTALHWLGAAELTGVYRAAAALLRRGGLLLNGDRLAFDDRSPVCRALSASLTESRRETAFAAGEPRVDWERWWSSLAGDPTLDALLSERDRRFASRLAASDRTHGISTLALHAGALLEAGFGEVDVIWQDLDRRVLLAVR